MGREKQGPVYRKIPPLPLGGGEYQPMSFGGKILKSKEKKGENVKEKGRKGKEKGRKWKENEEWIVLSINVKYLIMISLDCPF